MSQELTTRPWWKHWWGVLLMLFLGLLAFLMAYFFFYFFHYYSLAKQGKLSTADAAILNKFTISNRIAKQVASPTGQVNVVTADAPRFGAAESKLMIVEFADFGCPFSREESFIIRELASRFSDRITYIYRDFPLDDLHPQARLAAEAGRCANELGNFWALHDKMYQNQDQLSREDLIQYAKEVGIDEAGFLSCLDGGKYKAVVEKDLQDGLNAGVRGTPTFFLNGTRVEGAIPRDIFENLIESIAT